MKFSTYSQIDSLLRRNSSVTDRSLVESNWVFVVKRWCCFFEYFSVETPAAPEDGAAKDRKVLCPRGLQQRKLA